MNFKKEVGDYESDLLGLCEIENDIILDHNKK